MYFKPNHVCILILIGSGSQQDAHEFLTFMMDTLHNELMTLGSGGTSSDRGEGEWMEVGKKSKARILRQEIKFQNSLMSLIFSGKMRCVSKKCESDDN